MDDGFPFPAPVGSYRVNGFGLHDMLGNVAEWVADVHDVNAYRNRAAGPVDDPVVTTGFPNRVHRGSYFYQRSVYARSDARQAAGPNTAVDRLGFRVLLAPSP